MYSLLLISDETFKTLNIPISQEARKELDRKIKKGETVPPIISWKGRILTGYEQDEICLKYHRSFAVTKEMDFPRKSDAIAWLCHEQLKRDDLNSAANAWLISRLYEALRDIAKRHAAKDDFQYRRLSPTSSTSKTPSGPPRESGSILKELGIEFHCHKDTIHRYVRFGRQLDKLEELVPGARIKILTGSQAVMQSHMPALLKTPVEQLAQMINDKKTRRLIPSPEYYAPNQRVRKTRPKKEIKYEPGIKQMPKYDPDADLNGLRYTVGAWRKAITRTAIQANLKQASQSGKEDLAHALTKLITEAQFLCKMLEDKQDD